MSAYKTRRMYIFLLILSLASAATFQGWRTMLNNFAVDVAGIDGLEMGIIQSVREIPGFLALLAIYVIMVVREHRLAAASVAVMGVGVGVVGFSPTFWGLAATTLIMSFGFHYYETMNQSLTLQYFDHGEAPLVMGRLRSMNAAANVAIGGFVFVAAKGLSYEAMFLIVGGISVAAGLWCFFQDPTEKDLPVQRKKMVFRKKYWLYYALTFLAGARRQVFVAFAVFLLVKHFNYSVQAVTALFVANNVVNFFANPLIARAVNRFGERSVLSLEYGGLILVFLGYAFLDDPWLAGGLYIVDNLLFNFSMAIKTYFQKIADPKDIAPSMAVGFTINHVAAVVIPALGGLAWMVADYRTVFVAGAVISLASLILTQFIRIKKPV